MSRVVNRLLIHQKSTKNTAKIKVTELPKIIVANETSRSKFFSE